MKILLEASWLVVSQAHIGRPIRASALQVQSSEEPQYEEYDQYQAKSPAEPRTTVTTVPVIATAAEKQNEQDDTQDYSHVDSLLGLRSSPGTEAHNPLPPVPPAASTVSHRHWRDCRLRVISRGVGALAHARLCPMPRSSPLPAAVEDNSDHRLPTVIRRGRGVIWASLVHPGTRDFVALRRSSAVNSRAFTGRLK